MDHDRGPFVAPMRALLTAFSCLTALGFLALFVRADATDELFAWTILPPASAAFLGAGYAAGFVLVLLSLRGGDWPAARGPIVTVFVFALVTLVASLLHLKLFHLDGPGVIAQGAAWFWLAVYVVLPFAMVTAYLLQERAHGATPERDGRIPAWLSALLLAEGGVMAAIGVVMFVAPDDASSVWAWDVAPLSARVIAAWLVSFGVASVLAVRDGHLPRLRVPAIAYTVFGVVEATVPLLHAGDLEWGGPRPYVYLAFATLVVLTGLAGVRLTRPAAAAAPAAPPA